MNTRDRIRAEAARQLLDNGYSRFTITSVRAALGLSSGSMFHAFPSKPALAAAVYVDGMLDYQRTAVAALDSATDPTAALLAMLDAHLSWVQQHRELARFLFATLPEEVACEAKPALTDPNREFFAALTRRFEQLGLPTSVGYPLAHAIWIGPAQEYCRQWVRGAVEAPPSALAPVLRQAAVAALHAVVATPHP
ncbi:TetR/AcrR family transcriptional regulator [Nocardia sp. GCM10030253]|uniref:TetR/AcrR family transcriptional regulator n=1 Tax=Nocardia sp. GCM10030253 TaxID=3273404 RepID=UPI00362B0337